MKADFTNYKSSMNKLLKIKQKETCLLSGDQCNKDDICSETGFVNRFDGIREKSKEIYLNIHNLLDFRKIFAKILPNLIKFSLKTVILSNICRV